MTEDLGAFEILSFVKMGLGLGAMGVRMGWGGDI